MANSRDDEDAVLPVLSHAQAQHFHTLIVRSLQQRGLPHSWNGDDSYDIGGDTLGVSNLAATVAAAPAVDWPAMVDHHVGLFVNIKSQRPPATQLHMLYPRIRRQHNGRSTDYALEPADGIEVVLAVDYPMYVTELDTLDDVASLGAPEYLWMTALANLRALPVPDHELVELDEGPLPVALHAFQFEDYFGPSRLLLRNEFSRHYLPPSEHGFLVIIPDRHTLAATPLAKDVVLQCNRLAAIAQSLYETSPGATSPSVYHLDIDDTIDEVAYISADDSVYIRLNETMGTAMAG
ncbi:hypothetical protein ABQF34_23345 [Mycolicibacterium boenickei]